MSSNQASASSSPVKVDKFGFVVGTKDINGSSGISESKNKKNGGSKKPSKKLRSQLKRHESKWRTMIGDWDTWVTSKRPRLKNRCRKGIPDGLRSKAWELLCGGKMMKQRHDTPEWRAQHNNMSMFEHHSAVAIPKEHSLREYVEIIERDLDRTFPHHEMFLNREGQGQKMLRSVLNAYLVFNPDVGYCQGMGMVAGILLMYMIPEDAFWCLVSLLEQPQYLKGVFDSGLKEIQIMANVCHRLIKQQNKKLWTKLESQHMEPILYMTDWFMCVFVKTLPWESVLRIWDMFMFEGRKILYRASVAIVLLNEHALIKDCKEMHELMQHLRNLPVETLCVDKLLPKMLSLDLKQQSIVDFHLEAIKQYDSTHNPVQKKPIDPIPEPAFPSGSTTANSSNDNGNNTDSTKGNSSANNKHHRQMSDATAAAFVAAVNADGDGRITVESANPNYSSSSSRAESPSPLDVQSNQSARTSPLKYETSIGGSGSVTTITHNNNKNDNYSNSNNGDEEGEEEEEEENSAQLVQSGSWV